MKDMIRFWHVTALVLSGLLAAGCGGGGGEEPAPSEPAASEAPRTEEASSAPDACSLLTPAEIQEVMGEAAAEPQRAEGQGACTWPKADSSGPLVQVTLSGSGYDSYEDFVTSYQAEFGGEEPPTEYYRPIEGVGTWAMYLSDRGVVQAFQNGKMLELGTTPKDEARTVALAQKAIVRVP